MLRVNRSLRLETLSLHDITCPYILILKSYGIPLRLLLFDLLGSLKALLHVIMINGGGLIAMDLLYDCIFEDRVLRERGRSLKLCSIARRRLRCPLILLQRR